MKRLRKAGASRDWLFPFIDTLILLLTLYCSPVVFPGLLKLDFDILRMLVSLISRFTLVPNHTDVTRLVESHIPSTSTFVERILDDATHPLHEPMVSFRSMRRSRRAFRLAPARTETYRRAVLPSLTRFLTDTDSVRNELLRYLLQKQRSAPCRFMYRLFHIFVSFCWADDSYTERIIARLMCKAKYITHVLTY